MIRRPGTKETSHYGSRAEYRPRLANNQAPDPQYGVDMPAKYGGHVLFGRTYEGHTFIQTEEGGFQNFKQGVLLHGKGFFVNLLWQQQSGMFGKSVLSEKTDPPRVLNPKGNAEQDTISKILLEILN